MDKTFNIMLENETFFTTTKDGEVVSLQDIMTKKLGREVEFDEAMDALKQAKRDHFIRHFKHYKTI